MFDCCLLAFRTERTEERGREKVPSYVDIVLGCFVDWVVVL